MRNKWQFLKEADVYNVRQTKIVETIFLDIFQVASFEKKQEFNKFFEEFQVASK